MVRAFCALGPLAGAAEYGTIDNRDTGLLVVDALRIVSGRITMIPLPFLGWWLVEPFLC